MSATAAMRAAYAALTPAERRVLARHEALRILNATPSEGLPPLTCDDLADREFVDELLVCAEEDSNPALAKALAVLAS